MTNRNRSVYKFLLICVLMVMVFLLAMGIGSVPVSAVDIFKILTNKFFGIIHHLPVNALTESIFWKIRLPRIFLAFVSGGGLAISGVIMQSVLRNPLASSYTLGVSSGSAVGAGIAIFTNAAFFGSFTLPFFGLSFWLATVFFAVMLANKMDKNMGNTTIILTGMAISLFANSAVAFLLALSKEDAQKLIFWQLGSFSNKDWSYPFILLPVVIISIIIALVFAKEMDIITFGEEQAKTLGVNVIVIKYVLLGLSAVLTGTIVSFVGIIGFIDLFTPHVARRIFGSKHSLIIPSSVLLGGTFMVFCDLVARIATPPIELPIGAVTSAIGAPFFIYIYFKRQKVK